MIDMHIEFYTPDLKSTLKKLGFENGCIINSTQRGFIHGVKLGSKSGLVEEEGITFLGSYSKDSLLQNIKNAKVDLILDLDDNLNMFTEGVAGLAGEKKVGVCIDFCKLLNSYGYARSKILRNMRSLAKLCLRKGVPIIITSGARNIWELRGVHELIAFGELLGLNRSQARMGLDTYPKNYLKKRALFE